MSAATHKPWYKTWKVVPAVVFFPFTLSYLVLKQPWKTPVRIGVIALIWIVFWAMGSGSSSETTSVITNTEQQQEVQETPVPTPEITLEQKQEDYKKFYEEYFRLAQGVAVIQVGIVQISNSNLSVEELYLTLEQLSATQDALSSKVMELKTPDSLKDYKKLSSGRLNLALAASHFQKSIDEFNKYLDKRDLKALSEAKKRSDLGVEKLNESADAIDAVGVELGLDIEELKSELSLQ